MTGGKCMDKILEMNNVSVSFKEKKALNDLSFSVYENEIFGFLGPSGAGKTTTIKLLTKQLKKDCGEIAVLGKGIDNFQSEDYSNIGILSDNSGAYDRLSVLENLKFYAELRSIPFEDAEVLLKQVGLYDDRNTIVGKLSRGMKQRLLLIQAILHKPKLLFLDEPTAALDPSTTKQIHNLLRTLNNEGTTIFLTTHRMEEADQLCTRIAFLNEGTIIECGEPEKLKVKYAMDKIEATFKNGGKLFYDKSIESINKIYEIAKQDELITIHSVEPTIEDIFIELTGRKEL